MCFGGGGDTHTTTQVSDSSPWGPQQPYLRDVMGQAGGLYYGGAGQVAPATPAQQAGWNMTTDLATQGNPAVSGSNQMIADTVGGNYLGANPYLSSMYDAAAGRVTDNFQQAIQPQIQGQFSGSGRLGSGAYYNAMDRGYQGLSDSLTDMASNMYGQAYDSERSNMMTAAGMAPQLDQARYGGASNLLGIGGQQQAQAQAQLDQPWNALQNYAALVSGNFGGTTQSTSTQPLYSNPLGQGLGLLGALGGAGSSFGWW